VLFQVRVEEVPEARIRFPVVAGFAFSGRRFLLIGENKNREKAKRREMLPPVELRSIPSFKHARRPGFSPAERHA
jgi:hypothetical protein